MKNNYAYHEFVIDGDRVFDEANTFPDKKGFILSHRDTNEDFCQCIPINTETHEKFIITTKILPCKKVAFVIVECYNVPEKKFHRYLMSKDGMKELDNENVTQIRITEANMGSGAGPTKPFVPRCYTQEQDDIMRSVKK